MVEDFTNECKELILNLRRLISANNNHVRSLFKKALNGEICGSKKDINIISEMIELHEVMIDTLKKLESVELFEANEVVRSIKNKSVKALSRLDFMKKVMENYNQSH